MAVSTYVCNDVQAQAYEGSAADGAFNDDDGEITTADYAAVDGDDTLSFVDSHNVGGQYQYHRFDFIIDEDVGTITQIDITWKGYGTRSGIAGDAESLWVTESGSWVKKDFENNALVTIRTLTTQKTSGFADWISSGHLYVGAQGDNAAGGFFLEDASLRSYYVEVVVTYTTENDDKVKIYTSGEEAYNIKVED